MNLTLQDFGVTRKTATLSNGIHIAAYEKKGLPVLLRAVFVGGRRFDPEGKEGTAHLLEHMLVAGTERFPSKDKLAIFIEKLGGEFSARTSDNDIEVDIEIGDSADLAQAIDLLSEIINRPTFNAGTFEKERGSVLREMGNRHSNPRTFLGEVAVKLFFQDTTLGRRESEKSVAAITLDDVIAHYKNYITNGDLTILVGGEVEIDQAKNLLEKEFNGLSFKETDLGEPLPIARERSISSARYESSKEIHFVVGFHGTTRFDPDRASLRIIAEILGGGRASSLDRILRYERGLVYLIGAHTYSDVDHGMWEVSGASSKENLDEVLTLIRGEINRAFQGGLTDEEISFAKDKIIKSTRRTTQTVGTWVDVHTTAEQYGQAEKWSFPDFLNFVSAQSKEDIDRVAKKYLKPDSWYLAATGDITEDEIKFAY